MATNHHVKSKVVEPGHNDKIREYIRTIQKNQARIYHITVKLFLCHLICSISSLKKSRYVMTLLATNVASTLKFMLLSFNSTRIIFPICDGFLNPCTFWLLTGETFLSRNQCAESQRDSLLYLFHRSLTFGNCNIDMGDHSCSSSFLGSDGVRAHVVVMVTFSQLTLFIDITASAWVCDRKQIPSYKHIPKRGPGQWLEKLCPASWSSW